jgi:multiple sugar transport system ATP-binding protein
MAEVVLQRLTKIFSGGAVALENVNLTIEDGEFMVLVGPSGCGKSTLLRIVAGLEDATSGTVMIDGEVVDDLPPKDRDIAMVFQNYALYPHMTVAENMGFSLRIHRVAKDVARQRVAETAAVLGLDPLMGRKPKALSGGQRQRVAMGRAIVRQPKVFLMDEPLSNLDAKLRVAMRGELTRLHQRYGTTTIYVTHDQVEAMTLGDRIAVLNEGRLQQVGTSEELYRTPCNVFVAGFIGSPAMNLARGRIERTPDGLAVVLGDFHWTLPAPTVARPGIARYAGKPVLVGLRPNALRLAGPADLGTPRVIVPTVAVESLGNEKNVLFLPPFEVPDVTGQLTAAAANTGIDTELTTMWTATVEASADVVAGGKVALEFDLGDAYYFDAADGAAIRAPGREEMSPPGA